LGRGGGLVGAVVVRVVVVRAVGVVVVVVVVIDRVVVAEVVIDRVVVVGLVVGVVVVVGLLSISEEIDLVGRRLILLVVALRPIGVNSIILIVLCGVLLFMFEVVRVAGELEFHHFLQYIEGGVDLNLPVFRALLGGAFELPSGALL
jgi:hypothetical protein